MKKLLIIALLAAASVFTSCSIFVKTPHHAAGAAVGSTEKVKLVHGEKGEKM